MVLGGGGVDGSAFENGVEMMFVTPLERSKGRNGWKTPEDYEWLFTGVVW